MATFRPTLVLPLPDGWFAKESITILAPNGQGNVIASSEPLPTEIDARQYADVQGDLLAKEFDDYSEYTFEPALVFGGRPGYVRQFSWTTQEGQRVTQIQAYYAADGRGYTATATTPAVSFESFETVFRSVLAGMTLEQRAER
jgi:hypothetical protein